MSHPKNKLTSVGVQTEATSTVACLDSVWHSAIFSFIFISSHHVQNHKPVDKDTNRMSDYNQHYNKLRQNFYQACSISPVVAWRMKSVKAMTEKKQPLPDRLILHDADCRRWAEDRSVVVFVRHKHSGSDRTPAPLRGIHCLVCGPHHKVERRRWLTI